MGAALQLDVVRVLYFFVPAYVANIAPVLVQGHLSRLDRPLDGGRMLWGTRLLGAHKTWRGLVAGTIAGALAFELQRLLFQLGWGHALAPLDYAAAPGLLGVLLGLGTGVGDAVKSLVKRRIDIDPGEPWIGFDQLDFMVGAFVFAAPLHAPAMLPFLLCLPIVLCGSVLTTALGYELGLKASWI